MRLCQLRNRHIMRTRQARVACPNSAANSAADRTKFRCRTVRGIDLQDSDSTNIFFAGRQFLDAKPRFVPALRDKRGGWARARATTLLGRLCGGLGAVSLLVEIICPVKFEDEV